MKKNKIKFMVLTGIMTLAMGANVFAASVPTIGENGTETQPAKAPITKVFQIAEGIKTPNVTFDFTAVANTPKAPNATIKSITYSAADKNEAQNGVHKLSRNTEIEFESEFPYAGEYEYTVRETEGSTDGVIYDEKIYTVRVYVVNGTKNNTYVETITAEEGGKKKPIEFVNTYRKNAKLVIKKEIEGKNANLTKKFNFTINLTKAATETSSSFSGNIVKKDGSKTPVTYNAGVDNQFELGHGDRLEFENLPAGTRYEVKEIGIENDGYTPKVTVIENGEMTANAIQGTEKDDLSTAQSAHKVTNLVGEGQNSVTFVNMHKANPITGITMNNLPFVLMVVVAGLGMFAFGFARKHKYNNK